MDYCSVEFGQNECMVHRKKGGKMNPVKILVLTICAFFIAGNAFSVFAGDYDQTISVFRKSSAVQPFFNSAYGYAVFPTVGKGGIVVGGAYGKGRVYRQGDITGEVTLSKVSVGFQLGGQAFSEIIFFKTSGLMMTLSAAVLNLTPPCPPWSSPPVPRPKPAPRGQPPVPVPGPPQGPRLKSVTPKGWPCSSIPRGA